MGGVVACVEIHGGVTTGILNKCERTGSWIDSPREVTIAHSVIKCP